MQSLQKKGKSSTLSLISVKGVSHCPSLFQEVSEASYISYKHTPEVDFQE